MKPISSCSVCSIECSFRCAKCKLVSYCGRDHQSQDWESHKKVCFPIKLQFMPEYNRKVYIAKRDVPVGAAIFIDTPIMTFPVIHDEFEDQLVKSLMSGGQNVCVGCCLINVSNKCSKCQWPVCNEKCEKEPFHSNLECKIFANKFKHCTFHEVYFRGAIVRALMMKTEYPEKWEALLQRPHGYASIVPDLDYNRRKTSMLNFIHNVCGLKQFHTETVAKVMEIMEINLKAASIRPTCATLESLGANVIWGCLPNVVSHPSPFYESADGLDKFERYYYAMTDIKKGEALMAGINDNIMGTFERRQFISKYFGYYCICARCRDPTEGGTYFSAVVCGCMPMATLETRPFIDNRGYYLAIDPLNANSLWQCNNCTRNKSAGEIWSLVKSCMDVYQKSVKKFYQEFQFCFLEALNKATTAKNENRALTRDEQKRLDLCVESIPTAMATLYARIQGELHKLHPNHYILVKKRLLLLNGLFSYLQLNRKETCVADMIEIGPLAFSIQGFQFFNGVPENWVSMNQELHNESNILLHLFKMVLPDTFHECEVFNINLLFANWMIMKESAKIHRNFSQFVGDLAYWKVIKEKTDHGLLKYHTNERIRSLRLLVEKMNSQLPNDGENAFKMFANILEGKI